MKLENGVECSNNILIFPSWELYGQTIDMLDQMTEEYCDAFDANVSPNVTDEEYDALCNEQGFDEDNVIVNFENDLHFCSLRKYLEDKESQWLEMQGDGQWNVADDPDNHFIDEETERELLSIRAEVIIGDKKSNYTYYKFTDDKGGVVIVHNGDTNAMTQVSNGTIPANNPNVEIVNPGKADVTPPGCKSEIKEISYESDGGNRIKRKNKIRNESPWSAKRIVSVTIGYKKKGSKWKRKRTWITAALTNSTADGNGTYFIDCSVEQDVNNLKNKRRRRVKAKERFHRYDGNTNVAATTQSELIYTVNRQGVIDFRKDFYEMSPL